MATSRILDYARYRLAALVALTVVGLNTLTPARGQSTSEAVADSEALGSAARTAGAAPLGCGSETPLLASVPSCSVTSFARPEDSGCGDSVTAAQYNQLHFLARQSAVLIAQRSADLVSTMSCLFGTPVSSAQILDAAANVAQAYCSGGATAPVNVDCNVMSGAAASWSGSASTEFRGRLHLRPAGIFNPAGDQAAVGAMISITHETLHAMVSYMTRRYGVTTDPDPRMITDPAGPSGASGAPHSNRCLTTMMRSVRNSCDIHSAGARTPSAMEFPTTMSMYPIGGNCHALTESFDATCRASGSFREEAAVRLLSQRIAGQCDTSVAAFFSGGRFRAH